jgi:hypothetical protein
MLQSADSALCSPFALEIVTKKGHRMILILLTIFLICMSMHHK